MKHVKLIDRNPGKDPAVIDVEVIQDRVKYVAHLIIGDQVDTRGNMYPSKELRKMLTRDGCKKVV